MSWKGIHGPRVKGGQGGRLGHSNMMHVAGTEEIKQATRRLRRREDKAAIEEQTP